MTVEPRLALAGIPEGLRGPLLEEYNKLARNFREGRWEPAELNGGKFCEIVHTILRGYADGKFPAKPSKPRNMLAACQELEKCTNISRSARIQIPRILIALYEIRNNRNVGHVGADVDPNHMDATLVLSMSKWALSELVRIFHGVTTDEAASLVEALTERELPLIWRFGEHVRVLGQNLTAKDRTLALLYSSSTPLNVRSLCTSVEYSNITQFRAKVLKPAHKADLLHLDDKTDIVTISPVGIRYVEKSVPLTVD